MSTWYGVGRNSRLSGNEWLIDKQIEMMSWNVLSTNILENEHSCVNMKINCIITECNECDKQGQQYTNVRLIWRWILKKVVRTCDWKCFLCNVKWKDAWKNWITENSDTLLYS